MEQKSTSRTLNELLVNLFNNIMDIEAKAVITEEFKDITNNDMHIIEAIGIEEPQKMSVIARHLSVTVGTLTTAINRLIKKEYVERRRIEEDRRVVLIKLTNKGEKAFDSHAQFHDDMIKSIIQELPETEETVLIASLKRMTNFFEEKYNLLG